MISSDTSTTPTSQNGCPHPGRSAGWETRGQSSVLDATTHYHPLSHQPPLGHAFALPNWGCLFQGVVFDFVDRAILPPRGHLEIPGDIFDFHNSGRKGRVLLPSIRREARLLNILNAHSPLAPHNEDPDRGYVSSVSELTKTCLKSCYVTSLYYETWGTAQKGRPFSPQSSSPLTCSPLPVRNEETAPPARLRWPGCRE